MERRLRIGELAERTDVSADLLRAWERRYGLLRPARSEGGYRLYSSLDEARVRAMVRHVGSGIPAAEAARLVLEEDQPVEPVARAELPAMSAELRRALERFDDAGTQAALDALTASFSFETVAREVILPYLRELGERWERGEGVGGPRALRQHRPPRPPPRSRARLGSRRGPACAARVRARGAA